MNSKQCCNESICSGVWDHCRCPSMSSNLRHLDKPYGFLLIFWRISSSSNSKSFFQFAIIVIAFYCDAPSLSFVCSLSRSQWTKSCTGICCDRLVCLTALLVSIWILHLAMSVGQIMIWNLADLAVILRALQLVNSCKLKAVICISPKKMPSYGFYLFVMFFCLFARFS